MTKLELAPDEVVGSPTSVPKAGRDPGREPLLRLLIPGIACLFGASVGWYGASLIPEMALNGEPGPVLLPGGLTAGLYLLGTILIVISLVTGSIGATDSTDAINGAGVLRTIVALLLLVAYTASWGHIPFWLSTSLAVGALLFVLGERKIIKGAIFTASVALVLWSLFEIALRVPL